LAKDDEYEVKILKCKKKNLAEYLSPIQKGYSEAKQQLEQMNNCVNERKEALRNQDDDIKHRK